VVCVQLLVWFDRVVLVVVVVCSWSVLLFRLLSVSGSEAARSAVS